MTQKSTTILDTMIADVYLNKEDDTITILHDTAFDDELLSLEYDISSGELLFKFKSKDMPFGVELLGEFLDCLQDSERITVIQMEMETKTPISGMEVPLHLIN